MESLVGTLTQPLLEAKDELSAEEQEYVLLIEKTKKKHQEVLINSKFSKEDDQWEKWEKINKLASYLDRVIANNKETIESGDTIIISTNEVYEVLFKRLDEYMKEYKDAINYVPSLKLFYERKRVGEISGEGVLIYTFSHGENHEVFKRGDILVEMNGVSIHNLGHLKQLYKKFGDTNVVFWRLEDNHLVKKSSSTMGNTDVIGFLDIKQ